MKYINIAVVPFCFLLFAFVQQNVNLKADKSKSEITYKASHPLHKWSGVNKKVDCIVVYNPEQKTIGKVAVSCQVADFKTGNTSRDGHALEVLEAIKFPRVTFTSDKIVTQGDELMIDGNMTFHGVAQAVTLKATKKESNKEIAIMGHFPVSLTQYKVTRPSFMMMTTSDELELEFNLIFKK